MNFEKYVNEFWFRPYLGGYYLIFNKDFMEKKLPKQWEYEGLNNEDLKVELVLKKNPSVVFLDTIHVFYEDLGYGLEDSYSLKPYIYSDHYCPCHRVSGAEESGYVAKEEDYEQKDRCHCGEIIFDVKKIYCERFPNLILYSVTMSFKELENSLMSI